MNEDGLAPEIFVSQAIRLLRVASYLLLTGLLIPVQAAAVFAKSPLRTSLPLFYHRIVCRILGIDRQVSGAISTDRPTLFICNHASYLDIEILGSLLPASFIAKREVATWPLFGLLAKLQRTVFVDRRARSSVQQRDSLTERLMSKGNLILFPEGTSDDGVHLIPFKSALFAAAEIRVEGAPITVQPVTIAYTQLNGTPMRRQYRPSFAWYGDMALTPHLWQVLKSDRFTVTIDFHAPVTIDAFGSRKKLAQHCQQIIGDALAAANSGRRQPARKPMTSVTTAPALGGQGLGGQGLGTARVMMQPSQTVSAGS